MKSLLFLMLIVLLTGCNNSTNEEGKSQLNDPTQDTAKNKSGTLIKDNPEVGDSIKNRRDSVNHYPKK